MIPCVLYEDEHLLVVNKPAGLNTHAPSPYANEGIYEWLRCREKRWSRLSIIHRLDKETSGLLVFGLTDLANRELTNQFATRKIEKKYLLLTDRVLPALPFTAASKIARAGEKYANRPAAKDAQPAETRFDKPSAQLATQTSVPSTASNAFTLVLARPITGRTHQIRVHASENGFPILGDTLYGGTAASRVYLHSAELSLIHPKTRERMTFSAPANFAEEPGAALRAALINPDETNACRLVNGAADKSPGFYLDKLGDYLLAQSEKPLNENHRRFILDLSPVAADVRRRSPSNLSTAGGSKPTLEAQSSSPCPEQEARGEGFPSFTGGVAKGVYHKLLSRHVRGSPTASSSPKHILGNLAPEKIQIRENTIIYELSFSEGYSVGLFLDQRDNRRRLLTGYICPGFDLHHPQNSVGRVASRGVPPAPEYRSAPEALNLFAYTCGFSVCAAKAGYRATSLDLSKKYLDWGKRNFELNGLNATEHDFIYGDAFDWLRRFAKKEKRFDLVLIDPPTFSQSRESGVFRVEKDMPELVALATRVMKPDGLLFLSSNAAEWKPESFVAAMEDAVQNCGRRILNRQYYPQPPDFPATREEPAYLKTVWLKLSS